MPRWDLDSKSLAALLECILEDVNDSPVWFAAFYCRQPELTDADIGRVMYTAWKSIGNVDEESMLALCKQIIKSIEMRREIAQEEDDA